MKKIIAIILVVALVLGSVFAFTQCGVTTEDAALTMGDWVTLIADSFGMQNYTEETPHFAQVSSDEPTFSAFQAAAEWGIIEPSDEITPDTPVKWNDVLVSLVNAGEFLDSTASNEEKINFAIENFDSSVRDYWGDRYIKMKEAVPLLDAAQELWANKTYTEKIEEATFKEDVVDNIDNVEIEYVAKGDVITTSADELKDLKVGDFYTLPATDTTPASINKVKTIKKSGGKIIITNEANLTEEEIAEHVQEIKIQETSTPDFTKIGGIYDQNGNPINVTVDDSPTADGMNNDQGDVAAVSTQGEFPSATPLGFFDNVKGTAKFEIGDYSVSFSTTKTSFGIKLAKKIAKKSNRYREQEQEVFIGTTFENVKLTRDVDYSWGIVHSATVKLDYKTTVEGGISIERSGKIGNPVEEGKETKKSLSSTINQYKKSLQDLNKSIRETKCKDDIYICKFNVVEGGFATVYFVVKGKVTAEGEIKLVVEVEGAQGIQYKNGKFRYIKTKSVDVDFVAEATLEVTVCPGIEIKLLKWIDLIELSFDLGMGASVSMTAHLFDIENHELYSSSAQISIEDAEDLANEELYTTPEEIEQFAMEKGVSWDAEKKGYSGDITLHKGLCFEWKLYPIVRFNIGGENTLVGKIAKKCKVTLSVEILGKKNTILEGHIDFPNNLSNTFKSESFGEGLTALLGIGAECTYDYAPWDDAIEEVEKLDPATEELEIATSDRIELSTMRITISEGKSTWLTINGLPEGYDIKDIVGESEDPDIATVEDGKITGKSEGTTQIVVRTKDGKFKAYCAVTVTSDKKVDFSALPDSVNGSGVYT